MQLPDTISLPKLSTKEAKAIRLSGFDICRAGPTKPLANTPIDYIKFCGFQPEELVNQLNQKDGIVAFVGPLSAKSTGAVYAYHEEALQALLDSGDNPRILSENGWPQSARQFAHATYERSAKKKTALFDLIADAFADHTNVLRLHIKTEIRKDFDSEKIMDFLKRSAAGCAPDIQYDLTETERKVLASRMNMQDFIACQFGRTCGVRNRMGQGSLFCVFPDSKNLGGNNIYQDLVYTRDYDAKKAASLLLEANRSIRKQEPVSFAFSRKAWGMSAFDARFNEITFTMQEEVEDKINALRLATNRFPKTQKRIFDESAIQSSAPKAATIDHFVLSPNAPVVGKETARQGR